MHPKIAFAFFIVSSHSWATLVYNLLCQDLFCKPHCQASCTLFYICMFHVCFLSNFALDLVKFHSIIFSKLSRWFWIVFQSSKDLAILHIYFGNQSLQFLIQLTKVVQALKNTRTRSLWHFVQHFTVPHSWCGTIDEYFDSLRRLCICFIAISPSNS